MSRQFQRKIEDFTCENCGHKMLGTGYTNHCSKCLYSKHVDVNPGDRAAICNGLMKPAAVEMSHGEYVLVHKCVKCKFERKNKVAPEDDKEKVLEISQ